MYTFTALPLDADDVFQRNAEIIYPYIYSVIDVIVSQPYTLDYYDGGGGNIFAQFIGVDNPEMYFTGFIGTLLN